MIDFIGISKSYGRQDLFNEATFRINQGERVGIVGPNGAGKTTLFQILCGELSPDRGEVSCPKKVRLGHLRQQLDFYDPEESLMEFVCAADGELGKISARIHALESRLRGTENKTPLLHEIGHLQSVYEARGGYEMKHRAAAALAGLGFREADSERKIGAFSGGWQMRACMARTLLGEPDILLLDEPSNYLDIPAVEWLRKRLKSFPGTLLLVSHDRFLLNSITDVTLEVDGGRVTRYPGNYSYYVRERAERRRHAEAAQENIDRKKEQLERNINRFRAKATKAAQVQSWIKMLDRIEDTELPEDIHFKGTIRIPEPPRSGAETVRLESISFSYDGSRNILEGIDLSLNRGDKVGIVGYNGMGKTTLLKILAGRLAPQQGTRTFGHKVVTGYQAQEFAELLNPEMTAFDIVKEAAGGQVPAQRIREILGAFGFSGEGADKRCAVLSGGEKIRLCFARIFVNPPNFLILDEPTTHLDIAAREALQQAVNHFAGTVCVVSHDIEFIRGTAKTILEMRPPGIRVHHGNYDYFMERIAAEQNETSEVPEEPSVSAADTQKDRRRERAQKRQEMSKDKRRLEEETARLEKIIEDSEAEKAHLMEQWLVPSKEFDFAANQKRLAELECDIASATGKWEKSAAELEELMERYNALHDS
ncbi:MAG: putative ABC transporter ATP-binding protein YheS [Lentisphaerae bacterium ADurb.Bin242]|nr:MAG: putative ABC transporter ATP-binding protein YheS [Lentisphaerae bacterium ADurb.Bin242]